MVSATNLIVRRKFGPGPTIALNAHGDVVPPGAGWTHDPYGAEIVDGWLYGRGVAVSKSDIATYAFALKALESLNIALSGTVELHVTYDEEAGGEIGPRWLLEQGLTKPDLAIGAGFSYSVVNAHNGCLHLEVETRGRSAHAAKPFTGVDALEAATGVLSALYAWRSEPWRAGLGDPRHRFAADDRRADLRRGQHQRRARPRRLPARPADDPGREPGRGRGRARPRHRRGGQGFSAGASHRAPHPAGRTADPDAGRRKP